MNNYDTVICDAKKFDFASLLKQLFNRDDLYTLHEFAKGTDSGAMLCEVGKDSHTILHKMFYGKYNSGWKEFDAMYENFIKEVISPLYSKDFLYQRKVTIRFHLPDNLCVGAFHTDVDFGHPAHEDNYIFPMTWANSTSSVWVERESGKKDYECIRMRPAGLIKFSGGELSHGSKVNKTGLTRVSFDFRCLKLSDYNEQDTKESITTKTKFKIGDYYSLFKK